MRRGFLWTAMSAAMLAAAMLASAPSAWSAVLINVDKTTQRMTVIVDGETRHTWPVSTGIGKYDTPNGSWRAFRMVKDHYSREWDDAPMPHSIFFTERGHAIHGTDARSRLGGPASKGCVRLSRDNASTLFALVKKEGMAQTRVVVSGTQPEPAVVARRKTPAAAPRQAKAAAPAARTTRETTAATRRAQQQAAREQARAAQEEARARRAASRQRAQTEVVEIYEDVAPRVRRSAQAPQQQVYVDQYGRRYVGPAGAQPYGYGYRAPSVQGPVYLEVQRQPGAVYYHYR